MSANQSTGTSPDHIQNMIDVLDGYSLLVTGLEDMARDISEKIWGTQGVAWPDDVRDAWSTAIDGLYLAAIWLKIACSDSNLPLPIAYVHATKLANEQREAYNERFPCK